MKMPNTILKCNGVSHWFGANKVLHNINLRIEAGQIVGLVGPSGCGKSTLLRAVVGTHPAKGGSISTFHHAPGEPDHGREMRVKRPGRDRGIVYQRYTLMPFYNARKNVALGPKLDETTILQRINAFGWLARRRVHLSEAEEWLRRVGLGDAIHLYPSEMSGGMQQRVAIAQALIMKPRILLLDEPFGALDEDMREELNKMLLRFYQENLAAKQAGKSPPYTILIVTHELNEALYVGDRVIGLSQHWDWAAKGHDYCPGATIVYDQPAPVFHPDEEKEHHMFVHQKRDIKRSLKGNYLENEA
jgi:NitT/TauT family transport system ATP-binding protein